MEKKIQICIGTDRLGCVRARLSLMLVENDKILSEHYHSINLSPGSNYSALREANEADLSNPNSGIPGAPWPSIPDDAWADVEAHCAIVHKPSVVADFSAKQNRMFNA